MNSELPRDTSVEEVTPTTAAGVSQSGDDTAKLTSEDCAPPASTTETRLVSDSAPQVTAVDTAAEKTITEIRSEGDAVPQATAVDNAADNNIPDATAATLVASTKPARLTDEQIKEHDLARRSDGKNDDWVTLYLEEFPKEEQRDVEQLRGYVLDGAVALHETRDKDGQLVTWSMSQHYKPVEGASDLAFWLGCYTVTKRSSQSTGIGRVHFPRVIDALKVETPDYLGRMTEIESTAGLPATSQPVRRARFYQSIGLQELEFDYEIPLYQSVEATEYVPPAKRGKPIKGQLLISPFRDGPVSGALVRTIVRRIYEEGYNIQPTDPYMAERLALIDEAREDYLVPLRILSAADASSTDSKPQEQTK